MFGAAMCLHARILFASCVLLCAATLHAQVKVVPVTANVKDNVPICHQRAERVLAVVNTLPRPKKWTFYVACSPHIWQEIQSKVNWKSPYAFTGLDDKVTFINGEIYAPDFELPDFFTPELVVAHEIGHRVLNSEDERKVTAWARDALAHTSLDRPRIAGRCLRNCSHSALGEVRENLSSSRGPRPPTSDR
jgi:hypothetical protein